MYQEVWDLIDRNYSNLEDDECTMLVSKDDVHIGDAVDELFSKAQGDGRIRSYNVEVPCVFDSVGLAIYVLIISWINEDGSLGTYYTEIHCC